MLRLLLGLIIIMLFVGCSSKKEQALLDSYKQNSKYHKYLQQTEKAELSDGNTSVASLTATYMYKPSFEKKDTREEIFIVGVSFEEPEESTLNFDKKSISDNVNEYTLTLNGKKPQKLYV